MCHRMLEDWMRQEQKKPSLHPHAKHKTIAGPARLDLTVPGVLRLHVGMRKYGYVDLKIRRRDLRASGNQVMAALHDAWRC